MNDKKLIDIYANEYGITKKEAQKQIKGMSQEYKAELIKGFFENAKRAFCQD